MTERELASVIWIASLVAVFVLVPKLRRSIGPSLRGVIEAAFHPRIILVFSALLVWSAACILVGWKLDAWNVGLLKDTLIIVFAFGFPMLFHAIRVSSGISLLRQVVTAAAGGTALLVFYLNLVSFQLWAELIIQPMVALITMCSLLAARDANTKRLVPFFSVLLIGALLGSVAWTSSTLVATWGDLDWSQTLLSFLLTLWLPALLTPFFYVVAFGAYAESNLVRLTFVSEHKKLPRRVHLAFIIGLHFSVALAACFKGRYNGLAHESRYVGALRYMRTFRADVALRKSEEKARLDTLDRLEGVPGTDHEGAQLDRREFHITKDRLRWIAVTQGGRYEMNGNRYWDDLTDLMVDAERHGLPEQHGFVTQVTRDGQRWRSWRQLPNGWHLGIGAARDEGDYFFAGDEPPHTWPGLGGDWASDLSDPELPPDWQKSDDSVI